MSAKQDLLESAKSFEVQLSLKNDQSKKPPGRLLVWLFLLLF